MGANIKKGNKNKRDRKINSSGKYQVPTGWVVNDEGIFLLKYDRKGNEEQIPICYSPLKISGRGYTVDTEEVFLKLFWKDLKGRNCECFFPEKELYTGRGLMKNLPTKGVGVTDNTAKHLINFIFESLAFNKEFLKEYIFTEKHGWEKEKNNINKKEGF